MKFKKTLQKIGRYVYGVVGGTALITLIWAIYKIVQGQFFNTMGFLGSVGFFVLVIGGLNWGIKAIFKKDLFLN